MYSGTADAEPSASAPAIVTVRAAPTAVTYTGDTAGTIGIPIQVSARLDSVAEGAAGPIAGASMQFGMADQVTCTATTDAAGVASCTMIPNRIGNLAVTALSGGDVRYLGNQIDGFVLIGARPSATTVQAAPNPTPWGVDVTLTAAVPAAATGTVAFEAAGTTIGGCAAVPVADGGASCVTDALEVGSQQVTATYSGDAAFAGSSGTTSVQVDPRAVEIAYTGASTGVVGSALALSATATDALTGAPIAGLSIQLAFQGLVCGGTTDAGGVAGCNVVLRQAGTSDATVSSAGTAQYTGATGSGEVTISKAATTTAATLDVTEADVTEPVTITASVLPTDGGTVSFIDDGVAVAGCEAVPLVAGGGSAIPWTATCTSTLPAGDHTLEAIFSGTYNYLASAGSAVLTVHPAVTSLSYLGDSEGTVGTALQVSAQLAVAQPPAVAAAGDRVRGPQPSLLAAAAADPTGQRILFTLGSAQCDALTDADGVASCSLAPTAAADPAELTVTFAGTADLMASTLIVPLTVVAAPTPTDPPSSDPPTDTPSSAPPSTDAATSTSPTHSTPPSAGGLPGTGLTVGGWLAAGLALLGVGAILALTARHRAARRVP